MHLGEITHCSTAFTSLQICSIWTQVQCWISGPANKNSYYFSKNLL